MAFYLPPIVCVSFLVACPTAYAVFWYLFVRGRPCRSKERMDGKTVIVTGANTGIGKITALELARRGARVVIACRDVTKAAIAAVDIKEETGSENVVLKKLDLASCASIRKFSEEILQEEEAIHVLVCNAGVMITPTFQRTVDGFEMQFGVNHLGHFLLTNLLLDRIKASAPSRIVVLSSSAHYFGSLDFNDMMMEKSYNKYYAYCRSKLANVMFARELARRLEGTGVTVYSLHPGSIRTELQRHLYTGLWILLKVGDNSNPVLCITWKVEVHGAMYKALCLHSLLQLRNKALEL